MRILFVSNFYPPSSLGGVQLYTHGVAIEMQRLGHEVQVLCAASWDVGPSDFNGATDYLHEGISVRGLNLNWMKASDPFHWLFDNRTVKIETERMLVEFQPDVVHVTSPSHLSASVIFTAKDAGLPVVLTLPDYWMICPRFTLQHADGHVCDGNVTPWQCTQCLAWSATVYRWPSVLLPEGVVKRSLTWVGRHPALSRQRGLIGMIGDMANRRRTLSRAFDTADAVLAISRHVKDVLARSGQLNADKVKVHEWGLPDSSEGQCPHIAPGSSLRIAYFGRLTATKGVHVLLQAFRQVRGQAELHLHGGSHYDSDNYLHTLHRISDGDGRIHYHGSYQRADMGAMLAQTDVVVVPSTWPETYNLVVREALLRSIPVVASNVGAIPDAIWCERNGLLVAPDNVEELAAAMQRLVDDPALRDRLATGPRTVKTLEQEMSELISIYQSLLSEMKL